MKKYTLYFTFCFFLTVSQSFSNKIIDPIRQIQMDETEWMMDNPKGKWKIRFVKNDDQSDSTNRRKGFLNKLKDIVSNLMSDNPPFKVEIVREKAKEGVKR
jgi:hypothetical protein